MDQRLIRRHVFCCYQYGSAFTDVRLQNTGLSIMASHCITQCLQFLTSLRWCNETKKNQTPVLSTNRTPGKSQDKWDPIVLPFPYIVLVYRPVLPAKAYKRFYISVDATRGSRDPGATKTGSSENRDYKTSPSCYSLSIICSC